MLLYALIVLCLCDLSYRYVMEDCRVLFLEKIFCAETFYEFLVVELVAFEKISHLPTCKTISAYVRLHITALTRHMSQMWLR